MSRHDFPVDPRQGEMPSDYPDRSRHAPQQIPLEPPRELRDDHESTRPIEPVPERAPDHQPGAYSLGRHTFLLCESELKTMSDLGTFRVVAAADLARFVYGGDTSRMERETRRLKEQGLLVDRTLPASGRKSVRVLGLTRAGKRLLRATNLLSQTQAVYHGIVKVREAKHDAELYRLYRAEASRIASAGGRPLRVILDYEIKRDLNRERARLGDRRNHPGEIERLAEAHALTVVNGKIPLPDLRIEYHTADLELRRIDLELATRNYRPRGVAEKARAGFALYSPREDAPRLRRILDEQELTARIFAL